jgi:hypothetical protein
VFRPRNAISSTTNAAAIPNKGLGPVPIAGRPVNGARFRHLQKQGLVRLLEWGPVEDDNTIGPLTRTDPAPAHPVVVDWELLGRSPLRSSEDPPCADFATELNLRRHQLDAVLLWIHDGEQDDRLPALIDDLANAGPHQFFARF